MVCKNCGQEIDDEIPFCPFCGAQNNDISVELEETVEKHTPAAPSSEDIDFEVEGKSLDEISNDEVEERSFYEEKKIEEQSDEQREEHQNDDFSDLEDDVFVVKSVPEEKKESVSKSSNINKDGYYDDVVPMDLQEELTEAKRSMVGTILLVVGIALLALLVIFFALIMI